MTEEELDDLEQFRFSPFPLLQSSESKVMCLRANKNFCCKLRAAHQLETAEEE